MPNNQAKIRNARNKFSQLAGDRFPEKALRTSKQIRTVNAASEYLQQLNVLAKEPKYGAKFDSILLQLTELLLKIEAQPSSPKKVQPVKPPREDSYTEQRNR